MSDGSKQTTAKKQHDILFVLFVLLIVVIAIVGIYMLVRPVSTVSSSVNSSSEDISNISSTIPSIDQSLNQVSLTGTVSQFSGTTFSLNDGSNTWQLTLKSSAVVRTVAGTETNLSIANVDQSALKDGQRVTVRFIPTLETPISVVGVDIFK